MQMNERLWRACDYIGRNMGVSVCSFHNIALTSPLHLEDWMTRMAAQTRMAFRSMGLGANWWQHLSDPVIVFMGDSWVPYVVLPKGETQASLLDVTTGRMQTVTAELAAQLQPKAYQLFKTIPEKTRGVYDLMWVGLRRLKGHLKGLFFLLMILTLLRLVVPVSSQWLFDYVIPGGNVALFWQLAFALVLISMMLFLLNIVQSFTLMRYRALIENKMEAGLWAKFLNLSSTISQKYQRGDMIQRMSLIESIRPFLMGNTLITILNVPFSILYLALMLFYSVPLGLLMTTLMLIFYGVIACMRIYLLPLIRDILQKNAEINAFLIQMMAGIAKLRMAAAEKRAYAKWMALFIEMQKLGYEIGLREIAFNLLNVLYPIASIAITYGVAAYYLKDVMTMGQFVGFQTAFMMLAGAIGGMVNFMTSYLEVLQTVRRSNELLTEPEEQSGGKCWVERLSGRIAMENISFTYPGSDLPVLKDFYLSCEPGEVIGIVGKTGSGKSTILRLLAGLILPAKGEIYFDKQSIHSINFQSLRQQMGVVLQTSQIFFGSVKDNILVGRQVTPEMLTRALSLSTFDQVLETLPLGLETIIASGGGVLSGGERQRLLLARALLMDANVLLLDEATSALDSLTQGQIMTNLSGLGKTMLVVAHRVETLRGANRIICVGEGGRVK